MPATALSTDRLRAGAASAGDEAKPSGEGAADTTAGSSVAGAWFGAFVADNDISGGLSEFVPAEACDKR